MSTRVPWGGTEHRAVTRPPDPRGAPLHDEGLMIMTGKNRPTRKAPQNTPAPYGRTLSGLPRRAPIITFGKPSRALRLRALLASGRQESIVGRLRSIIRRPR